MYVNKCTKCGREFETKNPKRVICPDCLYPDKKMMISASSVDADSQTPAAPDMQQAEAQQPLRGYSTEEQPQFYSSYSSGGDNRGSYNAGYSNNRPQQRQYNNDGYRRDNRAGSYNNRGGYSNNRYNNQNRDNRSGGYNRGGYGNNRPQGGYNRPQNNRFNNNRSGGFNRAQNNRFGGKRPAKSRGPKQLLVSKEQLEQIELLYKAMLPLPNPDCHEVIGEKIGLEPRKVFFGINLVRQKMMLPKLPFPKRKLAISPDQLFAIKNLYEPLLPLPPIGCHKIIAAQLKMDEWRVHVGIGLIRSQMGLQRWNQEREDAPEEFRKAAQEAKAAEEAKAAPAKDEKTAEEKPKRGRKPKKTEETPES